MADVRVTGLPAASSLANGDVLHGVQAADSQDKKFSLTDLSTFFAGGAPISSVFGRTGAIVATNGDYDIGELGDVDLSVAPTSGQFLKWDGSNWIADNTPAVVVDLAYSSTASNGTVTNTAGTNATIPGATTLSAGLFSATDKVKLNGIATGAQVNVPADLGYTTAASTGTVTSSTGTDATIPAATTSLAGLLTSTDKTKLDGIAAGAQVNVATNLGYTTAASTGTVTSSTGTNATLPAATTSLAGLLTGADKTKLDGIQAGAQVNVATNLAYTTGASTGTITSSTGTNATIPAATTSVAGLLTSSDKSKLDGIAAGAQVNVATNLSNTPAASTLDVNSSTGTNTTLPAATTSAAGVMTSADKSKLNGIAAGAQTGTVTSVSGGTGLTGTVTTSGSINLANTAVSPGSYTLASITVDAQGRITSASNGSAGSGSVTSIATSAPITGGTITTSGTIGISAATTSAAGSMSAADKSKLDGIAAGATNVTNNTQIANGRGFTTNTGTVTSVATSGALTGGTITTSGTLSVRNGTTGQTGVVQLTTSVGSTSTTLAATASAVKSANDNANNRLARSGGTMTGGVYQTVRTISNNSTWNMSTGNLWHFGGGTIANPSNATAGMSGLIRVAAAVSGWGTNFDFPGGTQVSPTAFPALIPYYVSGTNVIMIGTPIEGIT